MTVPIEAISAAGPGPVDFGSSIKPIGPSLNSEAPPELERSDAAGDTFADLLARVMNTDAAAERAVEGNVLGRGPGLHETMLALEKADISFSLLVNVRNKLLDAYREVMRMG